MFLSWFVLLSPLNQQGFDSCHISAKSPWAQWPQKIYGCVLSAFISGLHLGSDSQINLFCYPPSPQKNTLQWCFLSLSLVLLVGAYRHNIWHNTLYCSLLNFGKIHVEICVKLTSALCFNGGFPDGASGKEPTCQWRKHGLGTFPEKAMATHSSDLACRIPWTEEPGRLQSIGS